MKRKLLAVLLTLMIVSVTLSFTTIAATTSPTTIGAPAHFGVSHYLGDYFNYVFSAPDELRTIIDNYDPKKALVIKAQLDYKLGNGDWHYTSDWDTAKMTLKNTIGFSYVRGESYITSGRSSLSAMFPDDAKALQPIKDSGWNIPGQPLSFRVRFVTSLDGNKSYIYSSWSNTYVYSKDVLANPDALINHAPTLTSATIEKNTAGMPFLNIKTGRLPGEVQDLNAMVGNSMFTEIWMRKTGEKDFKLINSSFFSNEFILVGVDDYFNKAQQSYDAEGYDIKIRYILNDLRKYPQAGRSDIIYSPFSNVFSQNMPAWSGASAWATTELKKAGEYGLIPDSLKGMDMTKPITREEFAELSVRLYEKVTGKAAAAASANPFTDTKNPEILKAYQLGITQGTSATTFTPRELTNREQVATMLSRAIRIMAPGGDFSTTGAPEFSDQRGISSWALEHVKFMSKMGIIKGSDGKFMPRATTTAQQAASYAATTREQAIAMSVRILEQYKGLGATQGTQVNSSVSQVTPSISNDTVKQNMEKLDSYRRKIKTVTTETRSVTAGKSESHKDFVSDKEFAYIRNPISRYTKLDFPGTGTNQDELSTGYHEEIIIDGKAWSKMSKNEKWTAWDSFISEKPVRLEYDLSTQHYPIDYQKLTYVKSGTEMVNGVNCIKYTVSGTYSDAFTDEYSSKPIPIKLTASGNIWIADDPAIKQVIIRQRITVNTEITFGPTQIFSKDTIEDDVMDINSVKIQPPVN